MLSLLKKRRDWTQLLPQNTTCCRPGVGLLRNWWPHNAHTVPPQTNTPRSDDFFPAHWIRGGTNALRFIRPHWVIENGTRALYFVPLATRGHFIFSQIRARGFCVSAVALAKVGYASVLQALGGQHAHQVCLLLNCIVVCPTCLVPL